MTNCKRQVTRKPLGPIGQMLKGPVGTRQMEKGLSGYFYDKLQASRMSNYRSHRYTSDEESTMWISITKAVHYISNVVHHRCVISAMMKPYWSHY